MEYIVNRISEHITQIIDPSLVSEFLVEGSDRAVLIDTGIGVKGLKETVQNLTSKPIQVLLTHGHGDHAGGCAAFSDVYLAPEDRNLVYAHGMKMRIGYCRMMLDGREKDEGVKIPFDPKQDMLPEPEADKFFKPLTDGMRFDLGSITLEIIKVPGHTKGSCTMLLPEERTILYGDSCNPNTLVAGEESTAISEYLSSLQHLKSMEDRFDTVLYSHGPAIGPKTAMDDNIDLCKKILAGTDDHVPTEFLGSFGYIAASRNEHGDRIDGRCGNIFYSARTKH